MVWEINMGVCPRLEFDKIMLFNCLGYIAFIYWEKKVKQYTLGINSLEEIGLLISKCQKYMLTNVHEYDDITRLTFHIM